MKLISFVIVIIFLISVNIITTQTAATDGKSITSSITPDSPLYFIDTALDQIRLLLTFDNTAKARVGLEIAQERLQEVREMVLQNKLEAAQRARHEHITALSTVETAAAGIQKANSTQQVEDVIKIEKEVEEHELKVEAITNELKVKIEVKGEITPQQQALIDSILSEMQNKTGEVKIKIDNKKGETKIKIKQQTGKSDEEIDDEMVEIERREGLIDIKRERATDRINDAREEIVEVKEKLPQANVTQVNITAANELLNQAELHLAIAGKAYNETKYGEAFGQATAAENLAKNAKRLLEKAKREIEVEVEENRAKIEIKIADAKMRYILNTTNKEEIISDIASKTGLSKDEIIALMKLEIEKEIREKAECSKDEDCKGLLCPQVLGMDTPQCKDEKCICGPKKERVVIRRGERGIEIED